MKVLIACEWSDEVGYAFRNKGHDVTSCDWLPSEGSPNHYQGDVRDLLGGPFAMVVAFPPCTRLANSGVRWLAERDLWAGMEEAAAFFNLFLDCKIPMKAIENPIHHKYARALIRKYTQIIQPWQFGHGETKATCLWLDGLPLLKETNRVEGREGRVWKEPPSIDRWKNRSRTYQGIADAMAEQWGSYE